MTAVLPGSWSIDPDQEPGSTVTLLTAEQGGLVRRTVLPGGLRIITEHVPGVRSAAFGIWVGVGSRDETHEQMGSAHYLEHLLFKGTRRREAMEISVAARRRRRGDERVHLQGAHLLLRARARPGPAAGHRRHLRHRHLGAAAGRGRRRRAGRDPGGDRHARRRSLRPGPRRVHARRCSATPTSAARSWGRTRPSPASAATRSHSFYRRALPAARRWWSQRAGAVDHDEVVRLVDPGVPGPPELPRRHLGAGRCPPVAVAPPVAPRPGCGCVARPTEQAHLVVGVPGVSACRRAPLPAEHPEHRAGRGHVLAAVPGDPRASRPGVLGVRVQLRLRRRRASSARTRAACRPRSTRSSS